MAEATPLYQIRLAVRAELADLNAGDTVLVAVSGGADSLALAPDYLPKQSQRRFEQLQSSLIMDSK